MRNVLILAVAMFVGGNVANNIVNLNTQPAVVEKAPVILGHRIGPDGQEMLVVSK